MHTNPFNYPYFKADFKKREYDKYWPFGQARTFVEFMVVTLRESISPGGLKGKMALGDAHPYLALFYLAYCVALSSRKKEKPRLYISGALADYLPCTG